ncbi:MAG: sulfotransferase [Myxococcota bacterium]
MGSELPKLLYITSRGHSGSTLTEMLIGAHSQVVPLGEIRQLGTDREEPCRCGGGPLPGCGFWKAVEQRVQAETGRTLHELSLQDPDDAVFVADNRAFVAACLAESGARWAIDSSKTLDRLQRLQDLGVFDLRVLHLTRSPFGVVHSNTKRGRPWLEHARNYTFAAMRERHFFAELGAEPPRADLRYERLVARPEHELRRVMQLVELPFEPGQLDWATQDVHTFAGNPMRTTRDSTIRPDTSWRRGLSVREIAGVAWWTLPIRFRGTRVFDEHRPYWKGDGVDAWKTFRQKRREKIRKARRLRWKKRPWIAGPYYTVKRGARAIAALLRGRASPP